MKPNERYILPAQLDPIDRFCKWFGIVVMCGLCVWWLVGCASVDHQWKQTRAPSIKPWLYVTVADTDFVCRTLGSDPEHKLGRINGCATWQPVNCIIYLPADAPRWLIDHEERHCEGWTH